MLSSLTWCAAGEWPRGKLDGMGESEARDDREGAVSAPHRRERSWPRRLALGAAVASLFAVLVPVLARFFSWEAGPLAYVVSMMPWVTLACLVPLGLALLARSRAIVAASLVPLVACAAWLAPLFVADAATHTSGVELRVATANLTYGQADAESVVAMVREHSIDVLAVQELTPAEVEALSAAGLDEVMPYSAIEPERGYQGVGVWSRLPFESAESLSGFASRAVRISVRVGTEPMTIYTVHPMAPGVRDHSTWVADMQALGRLLTPRVGAVMVAGDFNTTRDHRAFRDLESIGFVDAVDQAGAGFLPTFPDGGLPMPLVAIDHIIVRDVPLVAVDVETVTIAGADHRALVVTFAGN